MAHSESTTIAREAGQNAPEAPLINLAAFSALAPQADASAGRQDCRPIIDRNQTNGLSQAEATRDQIYDLFTREAAERGVDPLILKSPPFTSPPWVKVECWVRHPRDPALTLRSNVVFTVRSREFHRFPTEIDMVLSNDLKKITRRSVVAIDSKSAKRIFRHLLRESDSESFGLRRCRTSILQFWRPKNKFERLGPDRDSIVVTVLYLVGFVTIGFGGIGLLIMAGAWLWSRKLHKRHTLVLSAGKPSQEPRRLIRLDSWQALINDLGSEAESVKAAIARELAGASDENLIMEREQIWYWGVDGKEEREQLVLRFRRAMAFVHVYRYEKDLFVGWDAHVNCGTWLEQAAGSGYDDVTDELCVAHTIAAGWHSPNEYDLTDANCLLERTHAAVTRVIRRKVAEHRVDQEIDFKILREQRQGIIGREDDQGAKTSGRRGALSRFARVG